MGSSHYEETHMWDHYIMKKLTCGIITNEETHMWDHYIIEKLTFGMITLWRNSHVGSLHYKETHMWDDYTMKKLTCGIVSKFWKGGGRLCPWWTWESTMQQMEILFPQKIQQNFNHQIFDQQICNTFPKNKYLNSPDCKGQHCSYPQYTLFPKGLFSPTIDHQ